MAMAEKKQRIWNIMMQQKQPVKRIALIVFAHVEVVFQRIPEAPPRFFRTRSGPPFLLFVIGATITILLFMDHGVEVPANVCRHSQPLDNLESIHRHDEHIGKICQNNE
jgi:hypothetical protein